MNSGSYPARHSEEISLKSSDVIFREMVGGITGMIAIVFAGVK